jgi:Flp pilus assembly CpaE family ATPase
LFGPSWQELPIDFSPSTAVQLINHLAALAQYTVLDIARYPWSTCEASLRLCDCVMLVLEPDPLSLDSGRALLNQLRQWGVPRSAVCAVVVKRAPVSAPINLQELRSALDCNIAATLPPDPDGCLAALRQGVPLMKLRPDSLYAGIVATLGETLTKEKARQELAVTV